MVKTSAPTNEDSFPEKIPGPALYAVVVVGAGESGIAVGCRLKEKLGVTDFRIFDRQGGVGGAWYINKYPGVACDMSAVLTVPKISPALLYSYSFSPNYKWTTIFPSGSEILDYLESVCQKYGIFHQTQLNTEVSDARWLEDRQIWEVSVTKLVPKTGDISEAERRTKIRRQGYSSVYLEKEVVYAKILISCAGELVEPKPWPQDIPGIEVFKGDIFHTARWPPNVHLKDKDVIVIGTGCTAAQLVPCLTKEPFLAKTVTQLMRSPPWIFPRPKTPELWQKYSPGILSAVPGLGRLLRSMLFLYAESTWLSVGMSEWSKRRREKFQRKLSKHLHDTVPARYHGMLTPRFGVGCKRIIIDHQWFKSLSQPNMELTTRPLISVQSDSITLGPDPDTADSSYSKQRGEPITRPVDTIVLANGFDTSTYLHRLQVRGIEQKSLQDVWDERGGPQAYLSTAIDGFPNFFIILGPNAVTGHSSAILASENVITYAMNFIRLVLNGDAMQVQVKKEAELRYTADVQERTKSKVWTGCTNGYITPEGWNSSICP
ncbi:MAG: hypothetical protein M1818_002775 [Claussenomyces sp. TS43310]|nr:MAG: hypothetical protein M1818_002775 [Claussenomyces sp. TS43310]